MAAITCQNVTDADSIATIHAAIDAGINHLDTAHFYGVNGESEKLIAQALAGSEMRRTCTIATKAGMHYSATEGYIVDNSSQRIRFECEQSLQNLQVDCVDLLYLHMPQPDVEIEETATIFNELQREGKTRAVGVCNLPLDQLQRFHSVCPVVAFQAPYGMLYRRIEEELLPWCRQQKIDVLVYWVLMKGLLAGRYDRSHRFDTSDNRSRNVAFIGEEWEKNITLVEQLCELGKRCGKTLLEIVMQWTVTQPGVTSALCGARLPEQILETSRAAEGELPTEVRDQIDALLQERGTPKVKAPAM